MATMRIFSGQGELIEKILQTFFSLTSVQSLNITAKTMDRQRDIFDPTTEDRLIRFSYHMVFFNSKCLIRINIHSKRNFPFNMITFNFLENLKA